jgi:hypothetical protein
VSTEFRQHGIPNVFFTSVHSVCYTELPKIPRNYTEFRSRNAAEFRGIPRNSVMFLSLRNYARFLEAISEQLQPVNQDCLMEKTRVKNLLTPVLWIRIQIRIRKDPKLFAESGSVSRGYGSGSGFGSETGLKAY